MIIEKVINGRDNSIDLLLLVDGESYSFVGVNKVALVDVDGEIDEINSFDYPSYFDWTTDTVGKLIIKLGSHGLEVGKYIFKLIIYDAVNTNGIEWGRFLVKVS